MPSFDSLFPLAEPGGPLGDDERCLATVAELRVDGEATTTCTSAMPPLVMNTLVPFSTHSSPSRARGRPQDRLTSDPACGSVTA